MNVPEWMTRQAIAASTAASLDLDGKQVTARVQVTGWVMDGGLASAQVVFGPFPERVRASGVRVHVDDAVSVERFESVLVMPAGQTFRADVSIGVG